MTHAPQLPPTDPGPIKTVTLPDVPVWLSVLWAVAVVAAFVMLGAAFVVELRR